MSFEYNTQKPHLLLKEYGRNVQKLVRHVVQIDDLEKRSNYAHALIELMKQVNPNMKDYPEYAQKMWDDLFIISDFKLEVESPYPMPEKDILGRKPKRLNYTNRQTTFRHYGHNIELLIRRAMQLENPDDKQQAALYVGRMMRSFYNAWNNEMIDEAVICDHIKQISGGEIDLDVKMVKDNNLFDSFFKDSPQQNKGNSKSNKHKRSGSNQKRRRN